MRWKKNRLFLFHAEITIEKSKKYTCSNAWRGNTYDCLVLVSCDWVGISMCVTMCNVGMGKKSIRQNTQKSIVPHYDTVHVKGVTMQYKTKLFVTASVAIVLYPPLLNER